tara:strand:+ start:162 stop:725 length:564 start_codon:yes stop_codon:yes gene_type:complete
MADLKLDIIVVPTYNTLNLAIMDASVYPDDPPIVSNATIDIDVPGFGLVSLPFVVGELNIFTSSNLGISAIGVTEPLPDGIYHLKYSITPNTVNYVDKTIIRVDKLQEKFDEAFMKLDMMECDRAIATQSKVELTSIYFFIQGAIAAANNCAEVQSNKLYVQADRMLNNFIRNNCGCYGNNYLINFQ